MGQRHRITLGIERRLRALGRAGRDERPAALRRGVGRTPARRRGPARGRRSRGPSIAAVFITVFAVSLLFMAKGISARVSEGLTGASAGLSSAAGPAPLIGARRCADLEARGQPTPIHRGHPSYSPWLDRDGDGWACEPMPSRRRW